MIRHSGARPTRCGLLVTGSALCALAFALLVLQPAVAGSAGTADKAAGSASNQFLVAIGEAHLSVGAQSSALGENPSGHVRAQGDPDGAGQTEPFKLEGEVTCLRV